MERVDTILAYADGTNLTPTGRRLWTGGVLSLALLFCVGLAFCQERKTISPEKAMMIGYVEDFFKDNARDVTMRKSLEWGEVQTDGEGNRTIRYKFEALIWDRERIILCSDFTFDKDGNYVSMVSVEGFPQPVGNMGKTNEPPKEATEATKTLTQFLDFVRAYRIDKRIIDFPDEFDLSTPENAYATQKHLIVSNAENKFEKLMEMQFGEGRVSERERRGLSQQLPDEWIKKYKTEFVVYEVLEVKPGLAFVFALRTFDKLYDGNLFRKKEDGLWYNLGNFQEFSPEKLAKQTGFLKQERSADVEKAESTKIQADKDSQGNDPLQVSLANLLKFEGLTSYRVEKRIADMPEDDWTTPENAFAAQWHTVAANIVNRGDKEFAEVFKNRVLILEVLLSANKQKAFVLGHKGQSDYEGRFYTKQGNQWIKGDGSQADTPEKMAEKIKQARFF